MSDGQWRVLAIILAILGIEVFASPKTRQFFTDLAQGKNPLNELQGAPAALWGYGLGAMALVAIAAFSDGLATGLALLFLVIVLINRGDVIGPALQNGTNALMQLAGKNPQAGTQGK